MSMRSTFTWTAFSSFVLGHHFITSACSRTVMTPLYHVYTFREQGFNNSQLRAKGIQRDTTRALFGLIM
jgi:hypothetical protein